jgi:RecJ-like exonuclease
MSEEIKWEELPSRIICGKHDSGRDIFYDRDEMKEAANAKEGVIDFMMERMECPDCDGLGEVKAEACTQCGGKGIVVPFLYDAI